MNPRFGLHSYSATDLPAAKFIDVAAKCGASAVSLFIHVATDGRSVPGAPKRQFPVVDASQVTDVAAALSATGLELWNVDSFLISPTMMIENWKPVLDRAAMLGAKRVVAIMIEADPERGRDLLGDFCNQVRPFGMDVSLEFMGMTPGCRTIEAASRHVQALACPNLGLAIDAIHLFRTGGTLDAVAALPPGIVTHLQIDDHEGPFAEPRYDYIADSMNRRIPGEGDFPLGELIAILDGVDVEAEVPNALRQADGKPPDEHLRRVAEATVALISQTGK